MKQQNEVANLLSLIFQSGGQVEVKDSRLWVGPAVIAKRFGDQIRKLKSEILLALGHCPKCGRELNVKIEKCDGRTGRHLYCSGQEPWHYDKWEF